jgi:hypothetical protein
MPHALQATLDFTGFLFAVGITIYGVWISKYLGAGKIQRAFVMLVGSSIIMIIGELAGLVWNLGWGPEELEQLNAVMDVGFLAFVLLAMFLLHRTWRSLSSAPRERA